jgi:hypothetical protein
MWVSELTKHDSYIYEYQILRQTFRQLAATPRGARETAASFGA